MTICGNAVAEIEKLLENKIQDVRVGAVSIIDAIHVLLNHLAIIISLVQKKFP